MRLIAYCFVLFFVVLWSACTKGKDWERRELCDFDKHPGGLLAQMPATWRQIPPTSFRLLNYRFGESGEVSLSRAKGSIAANVSRWASQMGHEKENALKEITKVTLLGKEGYLVDFSGDFRGAMGVDAIKDARLIASLVNFGGEILVVKMLGKKEEVKQQKKHFLAFCQSLSLDR